jgi:holo-[acyl-carrier protein] synthase
MIAGIGVDIARFDDMEKAIEKDGASFMARVFTSAEIRYCRTKRNNYESFAGKYCVKEAVVKALSLALYGLDLKDIEILNDTKSGAPRVALHGKVEELSRRRGIKNIAITISHEHEYAIALAVAEE